MPKSTPLKIIRLALDLLQIALAILVVVLVSWRLIKISDFKVDDVKVECLLDGSEDTGAFTGTGFCIYAIAVGVISLIASAIFGCIRNCFKCITANVCGASRIIDIVADTALGVWWTVAFVFFLRRGTAANGLDWPEKAARDGVIAASFGALASFFADVIVTICSMAVSSSGNS